MQSYENRQEKNGHSQFNEVEVEAALKILKGIATSRNNCPSIMAICPYKAQRKIVAREIENQLPDHPIEATTVDAVQGGEAEVVLLLMTRSHGSSRFLLDEHRFNVALSRSEEASIILGDVQFLTRGNSGPMHELIEHGQDADTLNHIHIRNRDDMQDRIVGEVIE
jgi:superfamily I DNA and/or RNA helicase